MKTPSEEVPAEKITPASVTLPSSYGETMPPATASNATAPQPSAASPARGANYYPPGFAPLGGAAATVAATVPVKAPVRSSPPPETSSRGPARSPAPAAGSPDDIAALLPPGASASSTPAFDSSPVPTRPLGDRVERRVASVDELLPPGVAPSPVVSSSTVESAAPSLLEGKREPPDGIVVLPAADGGFVAVRESVKTVEFGGEEVELRKLTPEEKARRRMFRTLFMAVFGLIFLTAIAVALILLSG